MFNIFLRSWDLFNTSELLVRLRIYCMLFMGGRLILPFLTEKGVSSVWHKIRSDGEIWSVESSFIIIIITLVSTPVQSGSVRVLSKGQIELVSWVWHSTTSDGETPVLELWGMWSIPSLPLLSDLLWLGVALPARVPSSSQIKLFNPLTMCNQSTNIELCNTLFIYQT